MIKESAVSEAFYIFGDGAAKGSGVIKGSKGGLFSMTGAMEMFEIQRGARRHNYFIIIA